jgi:hypothetical protein
LSTCISCIYRPKPIKKCLTPLKPPARVIAITMCHLSTKIKTSVMRKPFSSSRLTVWRLD